MLDRRFLAMFALCVGCSSTSQSSQVDVPPSSAATAEPASTAPVKAVSSAATADNVKTIFVDAKRVPCDGEGVTECLRTRDAPEASWSLFYRTIEGFSFEPGYLYELRVEVTEVKRAPADAGSRRYRLVEIASKKRVP